jgi:COP9 signalosome complex subunit 1
MDMSLCLKWSFILQARIDSHNKILYARHADQRSSSFQKALQVGADFQRDTKALLLRANLMQHDFVVKAKKGQ